MSSASSAIPNSQSEIELPTLFIRPQTGWTAAGLKELWEYRELLYFLTWRDIKVRYKQTVLGAAWAIIQPFFMMVVFSLFFGYLAKVPSDGIPYPIFAYCALLPWQLCAHLGRTRRPAGFRDRLCHPVVDDGLLRRAAHVGHRHAARVSVAGDADRARRGLVALGAQRQVSRRALHDQLPDSVLAVCDAGGIFQFG